jgi:hypothetical protein
VIVLPPEFGASLGLGRHFAAGDFTTEWHAFSTQTSIGQQKLYVLRVEDGGGVRAYVFDAQAMDAFTRITEETKSGLIIPTGHERNGLHGR